MRTIGDLFRESRAKKNVNYHFLEQKTKIKSEFIRAIEAENWSKLPDFPVLQGFVKNIASALDVNPELALALLKRDYPPKKVEVNPKPDVASKFTWSPRLTFFLAVFVVMILMGGYLVFQYKSFIRPPLLSLSSPQEGALITENFVEIEGTTNPQATVIVNNQPLLVEEDGSFKEKLPVASTTENVVVTATSRSGKETIITRTIHVEEQ